jgi:hypothetical protein
MARRDQIIRGTIVVIAAVIVLLLIMMFWQRRPHCPDDQIPVLSDERWVCVKRGGEL